MPAKRITDSFVRNVKIPHKDDHPNQLTYLDRMERGLSLVLIVSYGGSKTFRALIYRDGRPHSRKLGTYPTLPVKDARAQARAYWQDPKRTPIQSAKAPTIRARSHAVTSICLAVCSDLGSCAGD
jgi:Arm DNA-binding domain